MLCNIISERGVKLQQQPRRSTDKAILFAGWGQIHTNSSVCCVEWRAAAAVAENFHKQRKREIINPRPSSCPLTLPSYVTFNLYKLCNFKKFLDI
jgi:hypothetical protein